MVSRLVRCGFQRVHKNSWLERVTLVTEIFFTFVTHSYRDLHYLCYTLLQRSSLPLLHTLTEIFITLPLYVLYIIIVETLTPFFLSPPSFSASSPLCYFLPIPSLHFLPFFPLPLSLWFLFTPCLVHRALHWESLLSVASFP